MLKTAVTVPHIRLRKGHLYNSIEERLHTGNMPASSSGNMVAWYDSKVWSPHQILVASSPPTRSSTCQSV